MPPEIPPLPSLHAYEVMHVYWHAHILVSPLLKILAIAHTLVLIGWAEDGHAANLCIYIC